MQSHHTEPRRRWRWGSEAGALAWVALTLLAGAGVAFALLRPGNLAYWVSSCSVVPLVFVAVIEFEDRWRVAGRAVKAAVWTVATGLALAGGLWATLAPGDRSWLVGLLMTVPLMVLILPILERGGEDGPAGLDGGGPMGPP